MLDSHSLPAEMLAGATLRDKEYGWSLEGFPSALRQAERFDLACLGGQIQFQFEDAIFEAYWLSADSSERGAEESWRDYVRRSCHEVGERFRELTANLNVEDIVQGWPGLRAALESGSNPYAALLFVAYFVSEAEYASLRKPE